jgi:hypothetical protein
VYRYDDSPPEFWEAADAFTAHEAWGRRYPVPIDAGTHLRLTQADGLWIGPEFDNPGWFHLEVLAGPLIGRCVVVDAIAPSYDLPSALRPWTPDFGLVP